MAKARVHRERTRITIEVDPQVRDEIAEWANAEGRKVSNLVRRVLSEIIDRRVTAREAAARRRLPIQKQLTA
jgi:hypothetical protein